jgi:hypothetical protein
MKASTHTTASAALGGRGRDTVLRRLTSDGRAVVFVATDLIPGRPVRLWGALAETGRGGVFIRLGILGVRDGWSSTELLAVALARFEAEVARTGETAVAEIVRSLELAAATYREPLGDEPVLPISFEAVTGVASPYAWTLARAGLFSIPLCPDPEGQQEGVTPAQLLAVLDLAMTAWLPVTPWRRSCWLARNAVREALTIESKRALAREMAASAAGAQAPVGM